MPTYAPSCPPGAGHAIVSFNASDQISNFASQFSFSPTSPVQTPSASPLAPSWSYALSTGLTTSLKLASITSPAVSFIWTGAVPGGAFAPTPPTGSCIDWSSASAGNTGIVGSVTSTSTSWVSLSNKTCTGAYTVLCLCVQP